MHIRYKDLFFDQITMNGVVASMQDNTVWIQTLKQSLGKFVIFNLLLNSSFSWISFQIYSTEKLKYSEFIRFETYDIYNPRRDAQTKTKSPVNIKITILSTILDQGKHLQWSWIAVPPRNINFSLRISE